MISVILGADILTELSSLQLCRSASNVIHSEDDASQPDHTQSASTNVNAGNLNEPTESNSGSSEETEELAMHAAIAAAKRLVHCGKFKKRLMI